MNCVFPRTCGYASRCVYTCAVNSSPAKCQPQSEWQRLPESQAQKSATCAFRHRHEAVTFLEQLWRWLPCQWRFWSANGTDVSASASCATKVSFLFFFKESTSYELLAPPFYEVRGKFILNITGHPSHLPYSGQKMAGPFWGRTLADRIQVIKYIICDYLLYKLVVAKVLMSTF